MKRVKKKIVFKSEKMTTTSLKRDRVLLNGSHELRSALMLQPEHIYLAPDEQE